MARRRLNDTAALTDQPWQQGVSHSVRTEKIDNGYLIHTSVCNPNTGEFRERCEFSAGPPRIMPARMDRRGRGPGDRDNTLQDAMTYLGDDRDSDGIH